MTMTSNQTANRKTEIKLLNHEQRLQQGVEQAAQTDPLYTLKGHLYYSTYVIWQDYSTAGSIQTLTAQRAILVEGVTRLRPVFL
jgi:hypothetical protein